MTPEELIESSGAPTRTTSEAPPLEILVREHETITANDSEEPASSPIVDVLTSTRHTEDTTTTPAANPPRGRQQGNGKNGSAVPRARSTAKNASSTAIMKNFLNACASCISLEELDETWDCWEEILGELPRGKDNCQAHWMMLVSKHTGNDISDDVKRSAEKLKPLLAN
jgi:hypothetical protein